jgi:hypothetical protein
LPGKNPLIELTASRAFGKRDHAERRLFCALSPRGHPQKIDAASLIGIGKRAIDPLSVPLSLASCEAEGKH